MSYYVITYFYVIRHLSRYFKIPIHSNIPLVKNLHQLWDSAGGMLSKSFPFISSDEVVAQAKEFMSVHTPESFGDRLSGDFDGLNIQMIAQETHEIARNFTYVEFPWGKLNQSFIPYRVSDEYIKMIYSVAKSQITLGGYRLAKFLERLSESVPKILEHPALNAVDTASPSPSLESPFWNYPNATYLLALSNVVLIAVCVALYKRSGWNRYQACG